MKIPQISIPLNKLRDIPMCGKECRTHFIENKDGQIFPWKKLFLKKVFKDKGLPWWLRSKESACNAGDLCRRHGFNPWVRRIPCRKKWQPIPVFLPGKFHGQWILVGYGPWSHKRVEHT